jgi:hypothetical protein
MACLGKRGALGGDIVATIGARRGCGGGCTILGIWEHDEGKI